MLATQHPVQALMGELMLEEELARKSGQLSFGVIARDCLEWSTEVRDVFVEIAADAERLAERVDLYASDGIFDGAEREQLLSDAREIEQEALTGEIL